ncbi:PAS domain S-box-containing protein [Filimonas zeae]|uniref:histidine kinase n=1 Tax=Filimonas zeae TaxID=1737353 RepID=A0A917J2P7_9BACT|nr:PAS domain-containing protein [Filimonas zeae]MDR6340820.1 PAS domain S-box-containing protein [Filimonas zeae]GGH78322.1 hypothetical protein GCM10011379_46040 [Filimonas zeae]
MYNLQSGDEDKQAKELYRLDVVKRYRELENTWQSELQEIVLLASEICDVPIALLSIVDKDQQVFITKHGTDLTGTEREIAFCNQTILQNDILVVPDAEKDAFFSSNPLVKGEPHIRFYAGASLTTNEGFNIGSLCVIDSKPKELSERQARCLQALSKQAIHLMDLSLSLKVANQCMLDMEQSELKMRAILDSSESYQILVGKQMEILAFNKAADEFIKFALGRGYELGDSVLNYTTPTSISSVIAAYNRALAGERVYGERNLNYYPGIDTWWDVSYSPARNSNGEIMGVSFYATDITNRKRNEQKLLVQNDKLREISQIQSHQVRGPLTSILGILNLIKEDNYQASKEYLLLLEKAAMQMDENIRRIVGINRQAGNQ